MRLPLYISVPHAGKRVAPELQNLCILRREDILADYDKGASAIYSSLQEHVEGFSTTDISRSLIDLNRSPEDIGGNGVIKSHTCWNVQVYRDFPDDNLVKTVLGRYYFPYHAKLSATAGSGTIRLGLDCHTMSAVGPPIGPDPGRKRPLICLSNRDGTCPEEWIHCLAGCFSQVFKENVAINSPFRGGYIIRSHASEMAWMQIEISQTDNYTNAFKRNCVLEGLQRFCDTVW
jgi:N-formylglutamate deformylase